MNHDEKRDHFETDENPIEKMTQKEFEAVATVDESTPSPDEITDESAPSSAAISGTATAKTSSNKTFTGSIRIKILAGFLTIVLLLVASAGYTLTQVRRMAVDTAHLLEQEIIVYHLYQEMTLAISERSSLISNYVLTDTRSYLDSFYQISAMSDEMIERLNELSDRPEDKEFIERSLAWRRIATGEVIPLYVNGRHDEAAKVIADRMAPEGTRLIQQAKLISESRQQEFLATGEALMGAQARVVNLIAVAVAAAVLIAAALALIVSSRITKPLKQVLIAANAVAEGDLRQEVPVMSNDETGQLAVAVNQMITSLKGLIKSSDFISEQVAATSEELAATAEEAAASSEEVAKTIHEVSRATGEQAVSVEESNRGMNSIAGHLQQVTASIDEVLNGSRTTLASAESGRGAARQAVDTMTQIRTATDETAVSVKALDEASREIVKIVDSIGAIADQTNLLALNAAIEAARAGDAGRGFAVVADEIRKLAEQSSQSSSQIATIITGIQQQIHGAVASMEANNQKVISGTGIVNEASSHFETILEEINLITQQIHQVTELVKEVNANSGEVVGHFESMSAVSEETAASAQQVSASAEEQTAAINEIAESSTELAALSQELRNAIAVFRY